MSPKLDLHHIQAFAFDLDGTLVDSIKDLAISANAMREALGMEHLPLETLKSFVGDGMGRLVHRALTNDHEALAEGHLWQQGFALFAKHYYEHIADYSSPYAGVVDGVTLLRSQNLPVVVVTNKAERFAVKLLADLGLLDEFSLVIGGDTLSEKKPSALPLQHVAEVLNVDANKIAMIGDSHNDILSARAAGAMAIGVDYGYEDMNLLAQDPQTRADVVIHSIVQLYDAVRQDDPQR
ncbi:MULTISPECIES: phosphoglycolate phosphatase [Vitreoscilla]|uniref:Phosphoglycolate phosphatase n=1 Tax=Vitreoscilla stercoraria TaxID=61 RepID=A0ABY4EED2_VITST|nr:MULTISPECIES: phosphoglycolate phosphatase [Vitreoscilla]QJQ52328.1 phosphoglycolate phosphatase [Vitreoscilla sp. C1]UOO93048.1 phosphoglycolate phosphatase [Vitreoscilla stercoraria]